MEPADYKHFVPPGLGLWLETWAEKQELMDLLQRGLIDSKEKALRF
jgi:hypothetical protein